MSITLEQIKIRHDLLVSVLYEKQYRLYLAAVAKALDWGDKTKKWLVIQTSVDTNEYAKGTKITDKEIQSIAIERDAFHGEWNYTISPL